MKLEQWVHFVIPIILQTGSSLPAADQTLINYMAQNLDVTFKVLDNLVGGTDWYLAYILLKNTGTFVIGKYNWVIYANIIRVIEPENFPYLNNKYVINSSGFRVEHVGGSLFKFDIHEPDFKVIKPGSEIRLDFKVKYWQVSRYEAMPNWYVTAEGLTPTTIVSTSNENLNFVQPFSASKQWKRYTEDIYDPYTARGRYTLNVDVTDNGRSNYVIIPTPIEMTTYGSATMTLDTDWVILKSTDFPSEVKFLSEQLNLTVVSTMQNSKCIFLTKGEVSFSNGRNDTKEQAYILATFPENNTILITASHPMGAFYGIQSLRSLLSENEDASKVPNIFIRDIPRYPYRGMHLDVARNFHTKGEVISLLNTMATYKLNKFHFHLADDEGWRLEIRDLPELTTIGANRCHDPSEMVCILPQLGSGPNSSLPGSGYFSAEEYQDILRHAVKLHIEVIPEFDMPGHARAAIKAMKARQQNMIKNDDINKANEYILVEDGDTSSYFSIQMFTDNAINPCLNSTYKFIEHVVREIKRLHQDIQPLKIFNFGGDEVASGAWENSDACHSFQKDNASINNINDLKEHFAKQVGYILSNEGLNMAAWEDGLMKTSKEPFSRSNLKPDDVYGYAWDNVWEWEVADRAYRLANAGYKTVISHGTHLYFDHPYEPDPEERGYYWATRYCDTRKTFGYMPDSVFKNADVTRAGHPVSMETVCGELGCTELNKEENIIGMQGQLWSETVRTADQLDYMVFPRLLALAERAWHKAPWESLTDKKTREKQKTKDWVIFANNLGYRELPKLDKIGVKYRIPPPGAVIEDKKLKVNAAYPGLNIEFSTDGGQNWRLAKNQPDVHHGQTIQIRTRSADGQRSSRVIELHISNHYSIGSLLVFNFYLIFVQFLTCVLVLYFI